MINEGTINCTDFLRLHLTLKKTTVNAEKKTKSETTILTT